MSSQPQQGFDYADYFAQISVLGDLLRDGSERSWLTTIPADPERKQFVVWLGCNVLDCAIRTKAPSRLTVSGLRW